MSQKEESVEKALEILGGEVEKAERRARKLEEELSDYKDIRRWMWMQPKRAEVDDAPDLPVPRLEMRQRKVHDFEYEWIQYLVLDDFALPESAVLFIVLGRTTTTGSNAWERDPELPYRDGAHIFHHMAQLKLPGFLTRFDENEEMVFCRRLSFDDGEVRDYTKQKYLKGGM
jgi:hypothetical protein